jgi:HK97 gp10 family phage protein
MLKAAFKRKKRTNWDGNLAEAVDRFLEEAATHVEGEAKVRAPYKTGRLRDSITHRVNADVAIVGTPVEYATHVEYGTVKMEAQPYMRPALDENRNTLRRMFRDIIGRIYRGR